MAWTDQDQAQLNWLLANPTAGDASKGVGSFGGQLTFTQVEQNLFNTHAGGTGPTLNVGGLVVTPDNPYYSFYQGLAQQYPSDFENNSLTATVNPDANSPTVAQKNYWAKPGDYTPSAAGATPGLLINPTIWQQTNNWMVANQQAPGEVPGFGAQYTNEVNAGLTANLAGTKKNIAESAPKGKTLIESIVSGVVLAGMAAVTGGAGASLGAATGVAGGATLGGAAGGVLGSALTSTVSGNPITAGGLIGGAVSGGLGANPGVGAGIGSSLGIGETGGNALLAALTQGAGTAIGGGNLKQILETAGIAGAGSAASAGAKSVLGDLFGTNAGAPAEGDVTAQRSLAQNGAQNTGGVQFNSQGQAVSQTTLSGGQLDNPISWQGTNAPHAGQGMTFATDQSFADYIDQIASGSPGGFVDLSNPDTQSKLSDFLNGSAGSSGLSTGEQTGASFLQGLGSSAAGALTKFGLSSLVGAGIKGAGALAASSNQAKAANQASQTAIGFYDQTQSNLQPYLQSGAEASKSLISGTGIDTNNPLSSSLLQPPKFTEQQLVNTPGYEFSLQQGLQSIQNRESSMGLGSSGAALKEAANFSTNLASQTYQNQYNDYVTNQTNQFQRLMSQAQTGENAAAGLGMYATETGGNVGSNTVGASNALSAAISSISGNVANTAQLYPLYNLLQQAGQGGNGGLYGS